MTYSAEDSGRPRLIKQGEVELAAPHSGRVSRKKQLIRNADAKISCEPQPILAATKIIDLSLDDERCDALPINNNSLNTQTGKMSNSELAASYAALILADDGIDITV